MKNESYNVEENQGRPPNCMIIVVHGFCPPLVFKDKYHTHNRLVHWLKVAYIGDTVFYVQNMCSVNEPYFEGKEVFPNKWDH